MVAIYLYSALLVLIALRAWFTPDPVLISPKSVAFVHVVYLLLVTVLTYGSIESLIIGSALVCVATVLVVLPGVTLIVPWNEGFVQRQITDAGRMLRITVVRSATDYDLVTKSGTSHMTIRSVALWGSLGTIRTSIINGGDAKIVLLHKLLKKKFASLMPHITIKLN